MSREARTNIQTGDLLAWDRNYQKGGGFWLKVVRLFTVSEYGHVSIAWRQGCELFHVEAAMPRIRVVKIPDDAEFAVIPMSRILNGPCDMDFFNDKIGLEYSISDAIRAYLGLTTHNDDRWQCAELVNAYYEALGIQLRAASLTPSNVVRAALSLCGMSLFRAEKRF